MDLYYGHTLAQKGTLISKRFEYSISHVRTLVVPTTFYTCAYLYKLNEQCDGIKNDVC